MNEDFRKTAPAALAPQPFAIAQPFETTLPNRLKVVVFEEKRLPLVSFRLGFKTGDADDPADANGLTAALTALLNEGTKTRTSLQLAEEIERLGASVGASAGDDNTIVAASSLSLYSSDILHLLADVVLNPVFPENELALYKKNAIENLKYQRSQPSFLAGERIAKLVYGAHPYGVIAADAGEIEKITTAALKAFHTQMFVPNNATLVVVGDVNRTELLAEITDVFGGWQAGGERTREFAAPPARTAATLTVVDRPGSLQSNIVLANLAIDRGSPDFFPVLVMNQILGAGASSRLFMSLREAKGYTYGAYSRFDARRLAGSFETNAEVRTPVTGDSLKEFFYELDRIRNEQATDKELQDAKNFLTGVFPLRAETQEGLTNLLLAQQLYDLPADYLQTYRDHVNSVTLADVQKAAEKYIAPDKIAIVIVGDADEIIKQARQYAPEIEVFDAEGKTLDVAAFGKEPSGAPAAVGGVWNLIIDYHGTPFPVTLSLKQADEAVSGTLDSALFKGDLTDAKVSGGKVTGVIKTQMGAQTMELNIAGTVEADQMNGTIATPALPAPLNFTGTKA